MQTIEQQIKEEMDAIRDGITGITRLVAKKAYEKIVDKSPVWTGSYISSHRIGINQRSAEGPTYRAPEDPMDVGSFYDPRCSYDEEMWLHDEAIAKSSETSQLQEPGVIYISNEVEHSMEVEASPLQYDAYGHGYREAQEVAKVLCEKAKNIPANSMRIFKSEGIKG